VISLAWLKNVSTWPIYASPLPLIPAEVPC